MAYLLWYQICLETSYVKFHLLLTPNLHHVHWCISSLLIVGWCVLTVEGPSREQGVSPPSPHPYTGYPGLLPDCFFPLPRTLWAQLPRPCSNAPSFQSPPTCPAQPWACCSPPIDKVWLLPLTVSSSADPGEYAFTVFFYTYQFLADRIIIIVYIGSWDRFSERDIFLFVE